MSSKGKWLVGTMVVATAAAVCGLYWWSNRHAGDRPPPPSSTPPPPSGDSSDRFSDAESLPDRPEEQTSPQFALLVKDLRAALNDVRRALRAIANHPPIKTVLLAFVAACVLQMVWIDFQEISRNVGEVLKANAGVLGWLAVGWSILAAVTVSLRHMVTSSIRFATFLWICATSLVEWVFARPRLVGVCAMVVALGLPA